MLKNIHQGRDNMLKEFLTKRKRDFKILYKTLVVAILGFLALNVPLNLLKDLGISLYSNKFIFNNIFLPRSGFMKFVSYAYLAWHTFKFFLILIIVTFKSLLDLMFMAYYKVIYLIKSIVKNKGE